MSVTAPLIRSEEATHTAVRSGNWSDPATWGGTLPGDGATVFVPDGLSVRYDTDSLDRIDRIRVDGELRFATDRDTTLYVDTLYTTPGSVLEIGSKARPIKAGVTAELVITGDGPDPIERDWDPNQLSRGIVAMGTVDIEGAQKTGATTLSGSALAGDGKLVLAAVPTGWAVGDEIVLAGTYYDKRGSDADNSRFHDEVLRITSIKGDTVTFVNESSGESGSNTLLWDHQLPPDSAAGDFAIDVANLTRNITVRSEAGPDAPIQDRGHVMFMENRDVEVRNAAFVDLGRTDKSVPIDDVGPQPDGTIGDGTNQRARYPVHLHRNDAEDVDGQPAVIEGVAVRGSPGWGIVQHDSYARFDKNVVFDVVGAGIVAESGNETGSWSDNLTIKTTGYGGNPSAASRGELFDFGFEGDGYWVQGAAQVAMTNNTAASAAGAGINVFTGFHTTDGGRDASTIPVAVLDESLRFLGTEARVDGGDPSRIDVSDVPLKKLQGFTAYNIDVGMEFWGHMRNQDQYLSLNDGEVSHSERALVEGFDLWAVQSQGIFLQYSAQMDFKDGVILGDGVNSTRLNYGKENAAGMGINFNEGSKDLNFSNLRVDGFSYGVRVGTGGRDWNDTDPTDAFDDGFYTRFKLEDSSIASRDVNLFYNSLNKANDLQQFPGFFELKNTTFEIATPDRAPVAALQATNFGPNGVVMLDGSSSFDPEKDMFKYQTGNGIAAYAWDFFNDGTVDAYGASTAWAPGPGQHEVRLIVNDAKGQVGSRTETVSVSSEAPVEGLSDPDFTTFKSAGRVGQDDARKGWFGRGFALDADGVSFTRAANPWIATVVESRDKFIGAGRFDLEFSHAEMNAEQNALTIQVYGIDGQFRLSGDSDDPRWGTYDRDKQQRLLLEQRVALAPSQTKLGLDLNFGQGNDFLLVRIQPELRNAESLELTRASLRNVPGAIYAYGGDGRDTLTGSDDDDELHGGFGNDVLYGYAGNDALYGQAAVDRLFGGVGNDTLNGADHDDRLYGEDGDDSLLGGSGADRLFGQLGRDIIKGNGGPDYIEGNGFEDRLYGGKDDDTIRGGNQNDTLGGGTGNDELHGDNGNDDVAGNDGDDTLFGGDGDDKLNAGNDDDQVYGGDGADSLHGGSGADRLFGQLGRDLVKGNAGPDHIEGQGFEDRLFGGQGADTIFGGNQDDILGGGPGNDELHGDDGDDDLAGNDGADTLFGGAGDDTLNAGRGDDVVFAGPGADKIWLGGGRDVVVFARGDQRDTVVDYVAGRTSVDLTDFGLTRADAERQAVQYGSTVRIALESGDQLDVLHANLSTVLDDLIL